MGHEGLPSAVCRGPLLIAKHQRPTAPFGEHGVYVGEFGLPESEATPPLALERTTVLLAEALRFGCPYDVYGQLYGNEPTAKPPTANIDYIGLWLVRPDGTRCESKPIHLRDEAIRAPLPTSVPYSVFLVPFCSNFHFPLQV